MRQDFFEFAPQFKLVIAGNHKPGLRTVDEAMRRRLKLLPFTVTIPIPERDLELTEKLRAEWGGILQWMIEGCISWQREGLDAPAVVREATADYLAAEDTLGRWLEECCASDKRCSTAASTLFGSWKTWCEQNGEQSGSQKALSENLQTRGFARLRQAHGKRAFSGLGLRSDTAG
jgi:putative DNA primase/helicase